MANKTMLCGVMLLGFVRVMNFIFWTLNVQFLKEQILSLLHENVVVDKQTVRLSFVLSVTLEVCEPRDRKVKGCLR